MVKFFSGIWNDEQAFQRFIAGGLFILGGVIKRNLISIGQLDPETMRNTGEVIQALGVVLAVGKLTSFMTKGASDEKPAEKPEEKKP